ncbi:MAG: HNH endonuclease [Planctomycetota bacterium]
MAGINRFFADRLGAVVRNPRWSWGAYDSVNQRVFLRVWKDHIETFQGQPAVSIFGKPRPDARRSAAREERLKHIQMFEAGVPTFGVICEARVAESNPPWSEASFETKPGIPRSIASFDDHRLAVLSGTEWVGDRQYAFISDYVAVDRMVDTGSGFPRLADDLAQALIQDETDADALLKARIGQGRFRDQLLERWGGACALTGCKELRAIRAGHIKPWKDSTNEERLDPQNGIPLLATLDALFDCGLISFDDGGGLMISCELGESDRLQMGLSESALRQKLTRRQRGYLSYHREIIYRA